MNYAAERRGTLAQNHASFGGAALVKSTLDVERYRLAQCQGFGKIKKCIGKIKPAGWELPVTIRPATCRHSLVRSPSVSTGGSIAITSPKTIRLRSRNYTQLCSLDGDSGLFYFRGEFWGGM